MTLTESSVIALVRKRRGDLGLTQPELAARTGLSIPAIQKIESGHGNPSLWTLLQLFSALRIDADLRVAVPNWAVLAQFGVPLVVEAPAPSHAQHAPSPTQAAELLRDACAYSELSERQRDALQATLLAISMHYPSYFEREFAANPSATQVLSRPISGHVIKLRRIALAKVSKTL